MEPEEHEGFLITEAPGLMFEATEIVPSAHFKRTFKGCTVESLKTFINYELKKMNKNKPDNNQR